ncbi:hypothetical protein FRB93_007403 [Tulasnella sp. JGI-2019a]|nr:hypothetical protein FRB93_007403 [Tulasnella sp. JGI-2019a]
MLFLRSPSRTDEPASGAHKLHDDMLYEIFIAATSDEHVVKAFTAREAEIITQVCRRWKTIAEHSPQLWTLVHIDMRYTPSRTARWLSLGRQMELAIRWELSWMRSREDVRSCVEMLKPEASRIGSFPSRTAHT